MKSTKDQLRTGEWNDFDRGFRAEMDALIKEAYGAFEQMEYKRALKAGLYDFENARNWYRMVSDPVNGGSGMHRDLVFAWLRAHALLITPFTPHYSEHIWKNVLGETSTIQTTLFPEPSGPIDPAVLEQTEYLRGVVDAIRSAEAQAGKKKGKKAAAAVYDPSKPKKVRMYVAKNFPEWQEKAVGVIKNHAWDGEKVDDVKLRKGLEEVGLMKDKKVMPFCQAFKVCSSPSFLAAEEC